MVFEFNLDLWPPMIRKHGYYAFSMPYILIIPSLLLLILDTKNKYQKKKTFAVIHPDGLDANWHCVMNVANRPLEKKPKSIGEKFPHSPKKW